MVDGTVNHGCVMSRLTKVTLIILTGLMLSGTLHAVIGPAADDWSIPRWLHALATGLMGGFVMWASQVWVRNRPVKPGWCACGYSRRGLDTDARCPECGGRP